MLYNGAFQEMYTQFFGMACAWKSKLTRGDGTDNANTSTTQNSHESCSNYVNAYTGKLGERALKTVHLAWILEWVLQDTKDGSHGELYTSYIYPIISLYLMFL